MRRLNPIILFIFLALLLTATAAHAAFIVQDGEGRAEIVISEEPPRMTKLAAEELQTYIQKISGAKLPIVTARAANRWSSQIYPRCASAFARCGRTTATCR